MEIESAVLKWLLQGDPSIRWQVLRDLMDSDDDSINSARQKIPFEGWAQNFFRCRRIRDCGAAASTLPNGSQPHIPGYSFAYFAFIDPISY